MKKLLILFCLVSASSVAWGDDQEECSTGQGTLLIGVVQSTPAFKHGKKLNGKELSHTHLTLKADQDGQIYDVAIDNIFADGYAAAGDNIPAPLDSIGINDRLSVCGQPFPGGIHWVHTDCGDAPTPSSPDGFVKKIGIAGSSGQNMENNQAYCYIFNQGAPHRATMRNALRVNLATVNNNPTLTDIEGVDDYLPDSGRTPGVTNPQVTQDNIQDTICVNGWAKTIRPPSNYTTDLKKRQMKELGLGGTASDYEEDHLISLEIGGDPKDEGNLWPEAYTGPYGARVKDRLENQLHKLVCSGDVSLVEAQQAIAANWIKAYCKYVPNAPSSMLACAKSSL